MLAVDCALRAIQPLKNVWADGWEPWDQYSVRLRLDQIKRNSSPPDVVVLGSSVANALVVGADYAGNSHVSRWQTANADYLGGKLSQLTGAHVSVANVSAMASMIADDHLMLQKLIDCGKAPKVVVLAVAPRDFIDNLVGQSAHDAYFKSGDFWHKALGKVGISADFPDQIVKSAWHFYAVRSDYRRVFDSSIAEGKPPSQIPAIDPRTDARVDSAAFNNQLQDYRARYLPISKINLAKQKAALNEICQVCQSHDIRLIMLNMPLTAPNRKLLPESFLGEYKSMLQTASLSHGCLWLDLDTDQSFVASDFRDSAHLCSAGAIKAINQIAGAIASDRACRDRLLFASRRDKLM